MEDKKLWYNAIYSRYARENHRGWGSNEVAIKGTRGEIVRFRMSGREPRFSK